MIVLVVVANIFIPDTGVRAEVVAATKGKGKYVTNRMKNKFYILLHKIIEDGNCI